MVYFTSCYLCRNYKGLFYSPQSYFQGLTVGFHDGLFDGDHHNKSEGGTNHESWGLGYTRGWSQGCRDSGRSGENCDVQAHADTP